MRRHPSRAGAVAGGADRIELCAALSLGGLTPSAGFMAHAAACGRPVRAMIRPRAGDFVWTKAELDLMAEDIAVVRRAGLAGVVLGASRPDGRLDQAALARLVAAAEGLDLTLHRCIDLVPDPDAALEEAVALGFRRILTSGGAVSAMAGASGIAGLVRQARGRLTIMAGAGVTAANAAALMALGVRELHGSCSEPVPVDGPVAALGFAPATERKTSAVQVKALKRAMEEAGGVQRHI